MNYNILIGAIGLVCTIGAFLIGYFAFRREKDNDIRNDASESAVIKTKLDAINRGVDDIRIDLKANEKQLMAFGERVTRVEESTKSLHKRLDHLENKGEM